MKNRTDERPVCALHHHPIGHFLVVTLYELHANARTRTKKKRLRERKNKRKLNYS